MLAAGAGADGLAGVDPGAVLGAPCVVGDGWEEGAGEPDVGWPGEVDSVGVVDVVTLVLGEVVVEFRCTSVRGTQVYDGSGMNPGGTT